MKKSEIIIISLIVVIICLLVYTIFFGSIKVKTSDERSSQTSQDTSRGVPVRADASGVTICLSGDPSPKDKIFLKLQETKGYPVSVQIDGISKGLMEPYSYLCEIYPYQVPFPCKHVYLEAIDLADPFSTDFHAEGLLCSASPFELGTGLPNGTILSHNFVFPSVPNDRHYFIVVQNQPPPQLPGNATIRLDVNIVGGLPSVPKSYIVNDKKILYYYASTSLTVNYTITHINGNNVIIDVYYVNK